MYGVHVSLALFVSLLPLAAVHGQLLSGAPGVLRAYSLLGGVVTGDLPALPALAPVSHTYGGGAGGCHCVRRPPGGKCCNFLAAPPPLGSKKTAACRCRRCAASYRCVARRSGTWCLRRRVRAVPRCVAYRAPHERCELRAVRLDVLVPYARPAGRPAAADSHPPRPTLFELFVAGHLACDVFQGASPRKILATTITSKVYRRAGLRVQGCAPIRLRCRDTSRIRLGVLVALKAGGKFYGTGMAGTKCVASAYQPRSWHSDKPQAREETEVVKDSPYQEVTWKEMMELTGARPIRARNPFRSIFTYVVITPPFCGGNYKGPVQ